MGALSTRRQREREIVDATRALFDERGVQDAPMGEIARLAKINKALIYRLFSSQEELFVLTATSYLEELTGALRELDVTLPARDRLVQCAQRFTDYGLAHPAFLDCCLSLMRRPARELLEVVSEGVLLRLGLGMAECVDCLADILRDGVADGSFVVDDVELTSNLLWTKALGALHLARLGVGVSRGDSGLPRFFPVHAEQVRAALVGDALATVGVAAAARAESA
jgi:AcrR family transcriptional regulator